MSALREEGKKKGGEERKVVPASTVVLVDLPLPVGQHVLPGAILAKVVQPKPIGRGKGGS